MFFLWWYDHSRREINHNLTSMTQFWNLDMRSLLRFSPHFSILRLFLWKSNSLVLLSDNTEKKQHNSVFFSLNCWFVLPECLYILSFRLYVKIVMQVKCIHYPKRKYQANQEQLQRYLEFYLSSLLLVCPPLIFRQMIPIMIKVKKSEKLVETL